MDMSNILQDSSSGRRLEYLIMRWISERINVTPHIAKEGGKAERCRTRTELNGNSTRSSGEGTELMEVDRHLRMKHEVMVTEIRLYAANKCNTQNAANKGNNQTLYYHF